MQASHSSFYSFCVHQNMQMNPWTDRKRFSFHGVYFAAAMNLPFEGGGFKFCPHADCRDGKLNIIVVSGLSKLKVLLLLPTAFFGLHTRFHGAHTYTCHSAEFLSAAELPVHTDGEPVLRQQRMMVRLENEKTSYENY